MRDGWMLCMTQVITEQVADASFQSWLLAPFAQMADHLINTCSNQGCQHGMSVTAINGSFV